MTSLGEAAFGRITPDGGITHFIIPEPPDFFLRVVTGITAGPDGNLCKTVALSQVGQGVSIWDIATGQRQRSNGYTNYTPEHLAFTPDGQTVMGIGVGELLNWKVTGGITTTSGVKGDGFAAIAPDAAIGGWADVGGLLRLFENVPNDGIRSYTLQVGNARCIAFGPGGKLAVGGEDKEVQLWDLTAAARKKIGSLTGPHNPPAKLSYAVTRGEVSSCGSKTTSSTGLGFSAERPCGTWDF
jgi:WD40 repeat protein